MIPSVAPLGVEPWAWTSAVAGLRAHLERATAVTVDDLVDLGVPRTAAVIVLAMLADCEQLHPCGGALAARPHLPTGGTPGFVWESWRTPRGGWVEIIGDIPRPVTSRHRGTTPAIWQCSECPTAAGSRIRLKTTRGLAVEHLAAHLHELGTQHGESGPTPIAPTASAAGLGVVRATPTGAPGGSR